MSDDPKHNCAHRTLRRKRRVAACSSARPSHAANAASLSGLFTVSSVNSASSQVPQRETTPFYPRSPYAAAKLYAYWIVARRGAGCVAGCRPRAPHGLHSADRVGQLPRGVRDAREQRRDEPVPLPTTTSVPTRSTRQREYANPTAPSSHTTPRALRPCPNTLLQGFCSTTSLIVMIHYCL